MEVSGMVNELQQLNDVTDLSKPSTNYHYQSFLQQLHPPHANPELYHNSYHPSSSAGLKDVTSSSIQVYQRNPPSYNESQSQPDLGDELNSRKFVANSFDSAPVQKEGSVKENASCSQSNSIETLEFNDKLIWCDECLTSKPSDCADHPPSIVSDRKLISRARQTLPSQFSIVSTPEGGHSVVTNKRLRKWARLGPLLGQQVAQDSHMGDKQADYMFRVFTAKDSFSYLDISDEDVCNWMMFIRPAGSAFDQNLVAYQHNGQIYFSAIATIGQGEELKVGYAESYAILMGVKTLKQLTPVEPLAVQPEKMVIFKDGFPCDSCDVVFEDFESLDSHSCPNEITRQDPIGKGRRTRNKRKGKPQKLGSAPKTKITAGDKKGSKLASRKVSAAKKYCSSKAQVEYMKCTDCELIFNGRRRLDIHMYVHTGEHPHKCTVSECLKSFNSKFKLDRHQLTHGSRDFTCLQCGKAFARRDNLQAHLIVHDSSRQLFRCEACSKEYSSKISFKVHMALHKVEEGTLECALCHKLYDNPQTLVQHIKVHAGSYKSKGIMEKKFKCTTCDKRFFASKDRDRHMLTHTKEKNFECNICLMKFSRSDHLKRHRLKIHPNGQPSAKPPRTSRTAKVDQLAELSASEFTRSIQQMFAETNLTLPDEAAVASLNAGAELGTSNAAVQITPMLTSGHRGDQLSFGSPQALTTGQRTGINSFLNTLTTSSNQNNASAKLPSAPANWQQAPPGDNTMRYVISGDTISQGDGGMPRYYITGDTVRLPLDGTVTTYLLPSVDANQSANVNMDSIQRQSSLLMDSSHTLPSDSLSDDFTADGMKVLTGLTPIFLNPDGTATDNDLIPIVYQPNQQ